MKLSKYTLVVIFLAVILFVIPFFWLKPGEMDLGGDSNRLYFYDPLSYLLQHTVYNIVPTGIGGEAVSYYALPYISLLVVLRTIISATFTIDLINGMKLGVGFFLCYLLIKELLHAKLPLYKNNIIEISSILSALFYTLSPILVNSGWDKAIFSHMQLFLNPLFFYLIFKYFLLNSKKYLIGLLLLSFFFSMAFSYAAAPPFFAFYPLSLLYIILYTKYIRDIKISIKNIIFSGVIFILLQGFHIIPHLLGIFSFGSDVSASVFSDEAKFSRGLDYFTAIADSIKVSVGLLALPQRIDDGFVSYLNIVFPLIIFVGFYYNKSKTLLLTGLFFLIVLFFACANITGTGFFVYKSLFYIPGFKMFRNFNGQWAFSFVFFYTLLFGQALPIVLSKIKVKYGILLSLAIISLLLLGSWRLLNGSMVNSFHYQSKKIKTVFEMDTKYEKVLHFVNDFPIDGKILTLPLSGPGYQVISGKNEEGAYVGPSTFSYLAGKNDYTGYAGLAPFSDFFIKSVKNQDYSVFKKLLSVLNVKYVFYNSDSKIYDDNFPSYPYDYVRIYMPNTQAGYKDFIQKLPLEFDKKIDFGDKFHFYPVEDVIFLPHIYTATEQIYANKPFTIQFNPEITTLATRAVFFDINKSKKENDNVIIEADSDSPLFLVNNNFHFHRHEPFISRTADDLFYPFVLLREKFDLWRRRNNHDAYVDYSNLYATKRIFEMVQFGEEMKIGKENWQEPHLWEFYKWNEYNTWNAEIVLYTQRVGDLIEWINSHSISESQRYADKLKINEQLNQHKVRLISSIKDNSRDNRDNSYIKSQINKMFDFLYVKLDLRKYNPDILTYKVTKPNLISGQYNVYVEDFKEGKDYSNMFLDVGNQKVRPISSISVNGLIQFQNVNLTNNNDIDVIFHSSQINLVKDLQWTSSGESEYSGDSSVNLRLSNLTIDGSGGLTKEILRWKGDKQYIISFDYRTFGNDFIFKVYDKGFNINDSSKLSGLVYFERNINSSSWKNAQTIIHADINSLNGYLQIISNSQKKNSIIELKNLSITQVNYPKIFFKKINVSPIQNARPNITFRKINPTKYEIHVTNATYPYSLVFSEAYSKHWKLFDVSSPNSDRLNVIKYSVGRLGKLIVSFFIHDDIKNNKRVTGLYFNGEISEMSPKKEFLNPSTFDSWGKKTVAYSTHIPANGYANAWYITPKDINGKTSYTLVLEMGNQRYFYIFLTISVVTAIILCICFIGLIFKNEKNL